MFNASIIRPAWAHLPITFYDDAKSERQSHEQRRLFARARDYVYAHPRLVGLGADPVVDHLVACAGFSAVDVPALRVAVGDRKVTALCVPTRLWRDEDSKVRLFALKKEAGTLGTDLILVPQRWLKGPVRSAVSRVVAQSRGAVYPRIHVRTVLECLHLSRISTLEEVAACLKDHDDPLAVVLSMASQGLVLLDRSAPLHGGTLVSAHL